MTNESSDDIILGWHWFVDFSGCETTPVRSTELEDVMVRSAQLAGANIVGRCFHEFSPHGLTGVLVIAESHFSVHTWPEHQAICIDIFSCTEQLDIESAVNYLASAFRAKTVETRMMNRYSRHGKSKDRNS